MDKFIARENIKHFRSLLNSEVDTGARSQLQKLLIEEEDKLGDSLELLADIDRHIEDGNRRIEKQQALVTTMERSGRAGSVQARALLDGLVETQSLHRNYRQQILTVVELRRNRL